MRGERSILGIFMTVFAAPREGFEELAGSTIAELARRVRLPLHEQKHDPESPRFEAGEPESDPVMRFDDPDVSVRAHLHRDAFDALWLLEWLSDRPWPGVSTLIAGHRRWWVGSLAHTLDRCGFRGDPAVSPCFAALRALLRDYDTGCSWFDRLAPTDGGVFELSAAAREQELSFGELDGSSLRPLLEAATALDRFEPPLGRVGIAPTVEDVDAWTKWVSGNVAALARYSDRHLVSIVT